MFYLNELLHLIAVHIDGTVGSYFIVNKIDFEVAGMMKNIITEHDKDDDMIIVYVLWVGLKISL